jgi:subtilase family serine protease/uncharacterized membrane protein
VSKVVGQRRNWLIPVLLVVLLLALLGAATPVFSRYEPEPGTERVAGINPMTYTNNSDNLRISLGEISSSGWNYRYDPVGQPDTFIQSVYSERYSVAADNWSGVMQSYSFSVDTNFGNPTNPDTATLHYGNLELTRRVVPPVGSARQFSIKYVLTNTSQSETLQNVRFFQGVDYDIYGSYNDYGWYAENSDIVWQNDDSYFRNGFGGSRRSSHHDCNYYSNMWSDISQGSLNDLNKYPETGTDDVGVALQWDSGDIPAGASWDLTITFYFGEAAGIQANAGNDRSVSRGAPVIFDGSRSESVDTIVKYEWDANDDGIYEINAGNSPTCTYAGWNDLLQHTVRLRITDDQGRVAEDTVNYTLVANVDLVITSFTFSPATDICDGNSVTFNLTIENQGPDSITDSFYVALNIDDNFTAHHQISGLAAGDSVSSNLTWIATGGNHTAKGIVDENAGVVEISESNNEAVDTLPAILYPDLTVSSLTWLPVAGIVDGDVQLLTATVTNLGPGSTSRTFDVGFRIDGSTFGSQLIPSGLSAGSSITLFQYWTAQAGSHIVSVKADETDLVPEADETNNTLTPSPNLRDVPLPELGIAALTWQPPADIIDGMSVTFAATVTNTGAGETRRDFVVRFDIDGLSIGSQSVIGGLPGGSSAQMTQTWKAVSGAHTARVVIDPDNAVFESNETNNIFIPDPNLPFIPQPELEVSGLLFTPDTGIGHGQSVNLTAQITNNGPGATATDLLVNFQIDGNFIGFRSIQGGLMAGVSASVTLPWTAVQGTHTVKAIVDPSNTVLESDETNNQLQINLPEIPAPPAVTVISPNGGQIWYGSQSISWTAVSPESLPLSINIDLYNGYTYKSLATELANTGTFLWDTTQYDDASAVPDGTNYKLRVTATDTRSVKGSDLSDNWLTIWNTPQVGLIYPNNLTTTETVNATYIMTISNLQPQADTFNLSLINSDNAAVAQLSQSTINLEAWASATFSLNVTDETAGIYNVTVQAKSQSNPAVSVLRPIKTQVLPSFGLGLDPTQSQTSIGGTYGYNLIITNNRGVGDSFDLSLSGLDAGWDTLPARVSLQPGETRRVPFSVNVPDSGLAGDYDFLVQASSTGLATGKQAAGSISVSAEPLISNLQPPSNIHTGATEVLVTWQTSVSASSKVFVKPQSEAVYAQISGTAGIDHAVILSGLSRNTTYDFYVSSEGAYGSAESMVRQFTIENGITFGQRSYNVTVERNYGQPVTITVRNTDTEPHNLLLSVQNVPADLQVNFVGEGSQDQAVPLHPGESKQVTLMVHAPEAQLSDYTLLLCLTSLDAQAISDSVEFHLHIHVPNIDFDLTEVSFDPATLIRTLKVTNNGDPLTDLGISMSSDLAGFLTFNPSINHLSLGTGKNLSFQAIPILSTGYTGASGTVTARAAGQENSLSLDFSMPPGKQIYHGHAPNMSVIYDSAFDDDGVANTNPDDSEIGSYLFETEDGSGTAYIAQIRVQALTNGQPAYLADVNLQVTGSGAPAIYTGVTDIWGNCVFTIVGPPGQYSYFAKLKGYPASTPVRTFSVSTAPALTMRPLSISWLSAADAGQVQDISGNPTSDVTLESPPFIITAVANDIPQGAVPVLFLTSDSGYSDGEIIGEIQGNNLVFKMGSEVDPVKYRATIGLQGQVLIATSGSRNFLFADTDAASGEDWNYNYQMPFPIDADTIGMLDIQNQVTAPNPHKLVKMVWMQPKDDKNTTLVYTYMIVSDQTIDDTLTVKVTDDNDNVLYEVTQPIHLEEYEPAFIDVPVPVFDSTGQRIEHYSIDVITLDYCRFTDWVKSWTTAPGGVLDGETWSIFWKNGALTPQNRAGVVFKCLGSFLPGLGTALTAIDTVNQATTGDWVATGGGLGQLATDPLEKLGTQSYDMAAKHVWNLIKNESPEMADAILKNSKGNLQKLLEQAKRVKNLASVARFAGYAANAKNNYDDWKRVTEQAEPNKSKAEIAQNMNDWYCTNRPVIGVDFGLPSSIPQYVTASPPTPNADVANLTIRFSPGFTSGSYKDVLPHDVHILLNGTEIGTLTNVVPNGHYTFPFDPALLHYAQQGTAKNTITVSTQHMNSGHYVVSSDFSIELQVKRVDMTVIASSQGEADQLVMQIAGTLTPKADFGVFQENFNLSDSHPTDSQRVRIETTIYNLGGIDRSGVPVRFMDNNNEIESWEIPYIPAYGSVNIATWWTAGMGSHNIAVSVNSDSNLTESDYTNNSASITVQVNEADTLPPAITNPLPADQSSINSNKPLITVDLADAASGVDPASVTISLDDDNVTAAATITASRVSYQPASVLPVGTHQIEVTAKDKKGNQSSLTTQFTVLAQLPMEVTTDIATEVLVYSATLNGTLIGLSDATSVALSFEYGLTKAYGSTISGTPAVLIAPGTFSAAVSGLAAGQTYHFRAVATGVTPVYGSDATFTTGVIPPSVITGAATAVTDNSVTLNAGLTALGSATSVALSFEYGLTDAYGSEISGLPPVLSAPGTFSADLVGLTTGQIYHFRAKVVGDSTVYGGDSVFIPGSIPPEVTTNPAAAITTSTAILNAELTSTGTASNVALSFEYGLTNSYGNTITGVPSELNTTGTFTANLSGLASGQTYHFRAKALGDGTAYGLDSVFTTSVITPPSVTTDNATGITDTAATLNGELTSMGGFSSAGLSFEYGLTDSYGNTVAGVPSELHAAGTFSANLSGLDSDQTYHFRAIATGDRPVYGADATFTTAVTPPSVTTGAATAISTTTATLNGELTSLGDSVSVVPAFEYGLSDSYGHTVAGVPSDLSATWNFTAALSGLTSGQTYHFRAIATGDVTGYGSDKTFTTANSSGGGGGGGGGGGSSTKNVTLSGLTSTTTLKINENGYLQSAGRLSTTDGKVILDIAKGTRLLTAGGSGLSIFTAAVLNSPPAPPTGDAIILAYTLGPEGAKFNPALSLTLSYDPAALPSGVAENGLYIAFHDGATWQPLDSTLDSVAKTVKAKTFHFSQFALVGKISQPPATITPAPTPSVKPTPDQTVTSTPSATTPPATTAVATAPATSLAPSAQPPITGTTSAVTQTVSTPIASSDSNMGVIIGIIAGVVVIILIVVFVIGKRRKK